MKMRNATLIIAALVIASGVLAGGADAQEQGFSMALSPSKLELAAEAGTSRDFAISLGNKGTEDQSMKVYFNDYFIKRDNDFVFAKPGHYSYSCAKWLQAEKSVVQVPAGQKVSTGFRVNVPKNAEPGGHYAVIFFEQVSIKDEGKSGVTARPRIGSLILVTVPGEIVRRGEIKDVSITSSWFWPARHVSIFPRRNVKARITFYNSGNVHLTIRGALTYEAAFGWGRGTVEFNDITVLPKTTRYLEADIPDPPLVGSFKVAAKVRYGPSLDEFDTAVTGSGSFNMYPLSMLLSIMAVLGAVVAVVFVPGKLTRKLRGEADGSPRASRDGGSAQAGPHDGDRGPGGEDDDGREAVDPNQPSLFELEDEGPRAGKPDSDEPEWRGWRK